MGLETQTEDEIQLAELLVFACSSNMTKKLGYVK